MTLTVRKKLSSKRMLKNTIEMELRLYYQREKNRRKCYHVHKPYVSSEN